MLKDAESVRAKLDTIANLAEDLSAEVFDDSPESAKKFGKIAAYCRRIATCVRLNGQVPLERANHPMTRIIRSVDRIAQNVKTVVEQLPRGEHYDD